MRTTLPAVVGEFEVMVDPEDLDAGETGVQAGGAVGRAANFARTLQSRPGNVATPSHLADEASTMASEYGLEVTVMGPEELEAERMHALLAVAQGSDEEPRLIVLRHNGGADGEAPLVLVGKGLHVRCGRDLYQTGQRYGGHDLRHVRGCRCHRSDAGCCRVEGPAQCGGNRAFVRESAQRTGHEAGRHHRVTRR